MHSKGDRARIYLCYRFPVSLWTSSSTSPSSVLRENHQVPLSDIRDSSCENLLTTENPSNTSNLGPTHYLLPSPTAHLPRYQGWLPVCSLLCRRGCRQIPVLPLSRPPKGPQPTPCFLLRASPCSPQPGLPSRGQACSPHLVEKVCFPPSSLSHSGTAGAPEGSSWGEMRCRGHRGQPRLFPCGTSVSPLPKIGLRLPEVSYPNATWYFCPPRIREQAQGSACQGPMATVPGAGAELWGRRAQASDLSREVPPVVFMGKRFPLP